MAKRGRRPTGNEQFSLRIAPDVLQWARKEARAFGVSISWVIEECLREEMEGRIENP